MGVVVVVLVVVDDELLETVSGFDVFPPAGLDEFPTAEPDVLLPAGLDETRG